MIFDCKVYQLFLEAGRVAVFKTYTKRMKFEVRNEVVIFPEDKSNISRLPLGHIIISDMGISCNYLFDETLIFFTAIKNRSLQFSLLQHLTK